jgi:hypothetical protein
MKGFELVKREDHWALYNEDGHKIASTLDGCNSKLSIKNCEAIERGYDLFEIAHEACNITDPLRLDSQKYKQDPYFMIGFNKGFQKALEFLGDNKFSELDMRIAYDAGCNNIDADNNIDFQDTINSLQQTEFDVEIEMEYKQQLANGYKNQYENVVVPKLDAEGNLILKRIEK